MDINAFVDQPTSLRQQTVYLRSYRRNIPSSQLQPYLDARPVQTKYSILPVVDPRKPINTPFIQQSTYNPETVFYPGDSMGPWSGYASNVNRESDLRNQIFALQDCGQSVYVPSSKSSLYNVQWSNSYVPQQPFPKLFEKQNFSPSNSNPHADKIGFSLFNNATRQQLKDLTKETKC